MAKHRRTLTEADFNLDSIRKALRLARRTVKSLETIEKAILKWKKADKQASKLEVQAAHDFYAPLAGIERREDEEVAHATVALIDDGDA